MRDTPEPLATGPLNAHAGWQRRRLLILGMTYPNYSRSHGEIACTGALVDGTREMIRLHPVPWRYIDASERFHAWQWIEATIRLNTSDGRPDSYRVLLDVGDDGAPVGITLGERESKKEIQAHHLRRSPNFFRDGYGELIRENQRRNTSLGIIQPARIESVRPVARRDDERTRWEDRGRECRAQLDLFDGGQHVLSALDFIPYDFVVKWYDKDGGEHNSPLHEWGHKELYRRLARREPAASAATKTANAIMQRIDQSKWEVFFFMGNFHNHQRQFGLMSALYIKRDAAAQRMLDIF